MEIFDNVFFLIYISGCFLALVLQIFVSIFYFLISYITKENILRKNLKKITEPDTRSFINRIIETLKMTIIGVLCSWINVIGVSITFISTLINTLRNWFQSTPESIKELRFPLYNNPNLTKEPVWAYTYALMIKGGERTAEHYALLNSLNEVKDYYPTFSKRTALKFLADLHIIESFSIDSILSQD